MKLATEKGLSSIADDGIFTISTEIDFLKMVEDESVNPLPEGYITYIINSQAVGESTEHPLISKFVRTTIAQLA